MKKIVITGCFFAILIGLLLLTVFGQRGFIHAMRLQSELNEIERRNIFLRQENESLKNDIELLKYDLNYLQELARKELGLVKEDELVYRLSDKGK